MVHGKGEGVINPEKSANVIFKLGEAESGRVRVIPAFCLSY